MSASMTSPPAAKSGMNEAAAPGRVRMSDYLSNEEIRALGETSTVRVLADIGLTWALVLAALALYHYYPWPPVFALSFVVIASRQLAMTHLVHDASHYRLFRSRRLNDLVSDLLVAGPVAISTQSYRVQHLPHHQYLGDSERDSDQRTWYNIKGWNFVKRTLLTLLGWEALLTFRSYARASGLQADQAAGGKADLLWRLLCAGLGNGLLLAYCWLLGDVFLYFWLWFVPMFTLTMYLLILRVIVEHQTLAYARRGVDCSGESFDQPLIRTVRPGLVGSFLLGPMNFHYHHEHHLAPSVPYPNLPRFHRLLVERGYYERFPEALGDSYFSVLWQLIFPDKVTPKNA